jgi:sugar/nucleoside kinase (ribokinase family)
MPDVYLYGMISASTVLVIDKNFDYPEPNDYAEIAQVLPSVGGEAVNSAIMLSKLGKTTKLDGNWLNQTVADKTLDLLKPFNLDVSRLTIKENFGTEEWVITDKHSRTVFGNYSAFHSGPKQWNDPRESDIREAAFVSIDPYFRDESRVAAEFCVKNRKPYVTLDCKYDNNIARNAEAVIISHELRNQAYRDADLSGIFQLYLESCNGLVIFTFGSDELWYGRRGQRIRKFQPYKIVPVDTTGAGDSFRAGIIFGLMNSWNDERTIDFASAVASCVCLTMPHTLNAPGLEGVLEFMNHQKSRNRI